MLIDIIPALAAFAFVSSITPGPNNLMLMASGANYGFRRSLPHMLGISLGFLVLMLATGVGLAQVFARFPAAHTALQIVSVCYLLYLAWKIATAAPLAARDTSARPLTFLQAAAFQWVNPKAWAMALTAITVHVADGGGWLLTGAALVFASINLPSITVWTVMGQQMARVLTRPAALRAFNLTLTALLVASLYPLLTL